MSFIYNAFIQLYLFAIKVSAYFNKKAAAWISGRRGIYVLLGAMNPSGKPLIWFHCASLGEFEQGRPVIESVRKAYPDHFMLLTFFSPSGFEVRKDYGQVDQVAYLPMDTIRNARRFLEHVRPVLAIFVKYEFWFNYIREMARRNMPLIVISASFRKDQHFFKWYGGWFRKNLRRINTIFVQREESRNLLGSIGYDRVVVSGDTRFDRVSAIANVKADVEAARLFKGNRKVLLAGSTWPKDEAVILSAYEALQERMKLIIAPHEVHPERVKELAASLQQSSVLYSEAWQSSLEGASVMIVDSIGLLSRLYKYGDIAYIGGGFGAGIHNILEAAAFGIPVVFGPNYGKFQEATDLMESGGAFSVGNSEQLTDLIVTLMEDEKFYQKAASTSAKYVRENQGATGKILAHLEKLIHN